jgi:hypothetical protein
MSSENVALLKSRMFWCGTNAALSMVGLFGFVLHPTIAGGALTLFNGAIAHWNWILAKRITPKEVKEPKDETPKNV